MHELDSTLFDWLTWRSNNIWNAFKIECRTHALVANQEILRAHSIGWCRGEHLLCRPKANNIAVMFFKDGRYFWTHFKTEEAQLIWGIH